MNTNELQHLLFLLMLPIIWFLPGIVLRRIVSNKRKIAKAEAQAKAIARLYPKQD